MASVKGKWRLVHTLSWLNYTLFFIGMIGVWVVTESYWAIFWTWIASLHFTFTARLT